MSEDSLQITAQTELSALALPEITAGALIRRSREASGLHIAALAVSLKVPVRRLEALEADRFDLLTEVVFVRALASSVCRNLKVDPTEILRLLPSQPAPRVDQGLEGRGLLDGATISHHRTTFLSTISLSALIGGLVLLLGAAALVFLPSFDNFWSKNLAVGEEVTSPLVLPEMAVEPTVPTQVADVPAAERSVTNATSSAVASGPVFPATLSAQSASSPATGIVVFRPTAESWVEVTDAKGVVILRRNLVASEVVGASGALPLTAIVGRADVTQVQIRGQAFDLTPVTRDNVARFEVK